MNSQEYVAIAVARWIAEHLKNNNDFACEGLPRLDVPTLFHELAEDKEFQSVAAEFSIALAGQNATSVDMAEMARRAGLGNLQAFTDDLHLAAEWRNDRQHHPRSIVLAAGYNAGVHTLSHYARPSGTALPRAMLKDAREKLPTRFPNSPEVHRTLLDTLETDPALESLLSLEECSAFLARWDELRQEKENHAPWMSLPALGLLMDKDLFAQDSLGKRLKLNLELTQQTRKLRTSTIRTLANKKYRDAEKQRLIAEAVVTVEHYLTAIQQGQENGLDLSMAKLVVSPPKEQEDFASSGESDSPDDENGGDSTRGGDPPPFSKASSDALLDGREEDLTAIADAIEQAWQDRDENSDDNVEITVALPGDGQEIKETVCVAKDVLGWVRDFCNETNWGGFFETPETSLRAALAGAADRSPTFLQPRAVVDIDGESLSLESILAAWDEDIPRLCPGVETQMAVTWREFSSLRNALLPHLGKLIYHPRHWLDGRPGILFQIRRYLELASTLYRETQEHYHVMESGSFDWARAALEALLALDTLQVRVLQPDGKILAKAVLLPTHPLHLWRNERLSTLLRGLASSTDMGADERETVRQELERPEQFLSVVHLSSLPAGLGLKQLLPYTDQIEGLPVFENLSNACSGPDGAKILREALDKFIILHPNYPHPLRVALVNPPRGEELIMELVRLLKDPRYRGGQKLSAIHIDIYASSLHRDRLHNALRFQDSRKEDEIQEQVAAGRLQLRVHDGVSGETSLASVVEQLRKQPCHVVAIFDESTIRLRQKTMGRILPMSPFCIRHDVQVDHRSGRIELRPQPGESPFSEFMQLMKELGRSQRDSIIQVYADAEDLADTADALLQGEQPAARWLFLADRALPSEAGMKSVRIWERKEGLRDTFLATRDFGVISRLLRPVFSRCNITLTPEAMQLLLHQGSRLLGSGLLDIIKKNDGLPDQKKVIGLAGLLFAARDMQVCYPGAMVLSVDHPLARMWLRTGKRQSLAERCDLLVLWKDEKSGGYELIAVEVKTSDDEQLVNAPARASHADSQIRNTLEAVQDGLGAAGSGQSSPLSIPRCEMLKHTLVRAAQARSGDPETDRANRIRWGAWLMELFGQTAPNVTLSGCLVSVLLRRTAPSIEEKLDTPGPWTVVHRVLGEKDASDLLGKKTASSDFPQETVPTTPKATIENSLQPIDPNLMDPSETPDQVHPGLTSNDKVQVSSSGEKPPFINDVIRDRAVTLSPSDAKLDEPWPPAVNKLEMIGQYEAVERLVEQALFSKDMGKRFPDKLLVGPAGVGKSTLARKIGTLLLGRESLFFNGADLRRPSEIVDKLVQENLLENHSTGRAVSISPCLIFIDEVHGISNAVATVLLSAMDDRRTTTIDGRMYDFNQVVLLLATTDPGRLSEAFQSRPSKTWLRPYTLHELAGIVWLHGKECLDGAELAQDVCYEIAARNRCNPRRSVRELGETLVPHFFQRAKAEQRGKTVSLKETAAIMTREQIADFYEKQGVDLNGLDNLAKRFLRYLKERGSCSESTLRQGLGLAHSQDFVEAAEYLVRLGLIETSTAGRRLTQTGERYLRSAIPLDLRERISRAGP